MQRTPTSQLDDLSIFCHILVRREKKKVIEVAELLGKHHATVIFHLQRYDDAISLCEKFKQWPSSKDFKAKVDNFKLEDFVKNYKQKDIYLDPMTYEDVEHFFIH
ncbi:hypothetical protein [Epilithonimonas caeni]|uniref:hypothetical protein n=1 Tax=Epilithonimonas caeni TaxID=365343 RepID=UPI000489F8BE|nr:hypothetical protein [Epilithonimonas caeni]